MADADNDLRHDVYMSVLLFGFWGHDLTCNSEVISCPKNYETRAINLRLEGERESEKVAEFLLSLCLCVLYVLRLKHMYLQRCWNLQRMFVHTSVLQLVLSES